MALIQNEVTVIPGTNMYLHSCSSCGFSRESGFAYGKHNCRARRITVPRIACGDILESMLTAVGLTKTRVQKWTRLKDCGCKSRQRWLNQWGYRQQERVENMLNYMLRFYLGK